MTNDTVDLGPHRSGAKILAKNTITGAKITKAPVSLYQVIEFLQSQYAITVERVSFPEAISGLTVTCKQLDSEYTTIGFNENHPWCRRRFTLAHEIGHLLMGHSCIKNELKNSSGSHNETEANIFASELLVPSQFIKTDFENTPHIPTLAKIYRVSDQTMSYKLMNDGLL